MNTPLPPVLSTEQMASLLDCAETTVEDLARRQELAGLQYGRGWIFPLEANLRVLNDRALARVKTPSPPPPAPKLPPAIAVPVPPPRARRQPVAIPDMGSLP